MANRVLAALCAILVAVPAIVSADSYFFRCTVDNCELRNTELIQQHTIYREIIRESASTNPDGASFAAIVGLVKVCKKERRIFDNAVLWFNDQFLFGTKRNEEINHTDVLGVNTGNKTDRFIGCIVPNGFIVAVPQGSEFASSEDLEARFAQDRKRPGCPPSPVSAGNANCIFRYTRTSYYVTDPNGFHWVIDQFRYNRTDPFTEALESPSVPTVASNAKSETMLIAHLQVDPTDSEPIRDEVMWRWRDTGQIRSGTPRFETEDDHGQPVNETHACRTDIRCAIEYTFLLAVGVGGGQVTHTNTTTDESKAGYSHGSNPTDAETHMGPCRADSWANKSKNPPINAPYHDCAGNPPSNETLDTPSHKHSSAKFDLFVVKKGPKYLHDHPYWDSYGAPGVPSNHDTCNDSSVPGLAASQRTFVICDVVADSGFHLHDGSQTIT